MFLTKKSWYFGLKCTIYRKKAYLIQIRQNEKAKNEKRV